MSFGFGIGDIVLASGAVFNLYTAIHNALDEQQSLMIEVEMLRQLIGQMAADTTLVSPLPIGGAASLGPLIQTAPTRQLSRCLQLLQNIDSIATRYIGDGASLGTSDGRRKSRSRVLRWGLYKRTEFLGLLGDLRNMIDLLHTLQQSANRSPAPPIQSPGSASYIELTDALDRPWVCSFEHCNTYEVSSGQHCHS